MKGKNRGVGVVKEIWLGKQHVAESFHFYYKISFCLYLLWIHIEFLLPNGHLFILRIVFAKNEKKGRENIRTISNYSDPFYHLGPKNVSWPLLLAIYINLNALAISSYNTQYK